MLSLVPRLLIDENEPRQFLRYCFGISHLPPEEALEEETYFIYCTQCVRLLSKILGIQRKTVRSWGDNPNFEGMPQHTRMTCNYAQLALSKEKLYRMIGQDFDAPKFIAISLHKLKNMPKHYEHTLAYALAAYQKQQTATQGNAA